MTIPNSNALLMAESCLPLTPDEERETIAELNRAADSNRKEGDIFCLISAGWFREWEEYVQIKSSKEVSTSIEYLNGALQHSCCCPEKIDNSELVTYGTYDGGNGLELRRNLQEGQDYSLVPYEVWKKLHEWYKGGPEIPRKLISEGIRRSLVVEVYPLSLNLVDARDESQRIITMSRKASVGELYKFVCTLLKIAQAKVDIWDFYENQKHALLNNFDETLQEAQLQTDQEILLELKDDKPFPSISGMDSTGNKMALIPIEPPRSPITIASGLTASNGVSSGFGGHFLQGNNFSSILRDTDEDDDFLADGTTVDGRGLTGLHNLGNNCFMNSALQCLVHTPKLVQFFVQDYTQEINKKNPLGMQGELAIAFGDLLRKLWSSGRTSVAPRAFKLKLSRFAPQFSGYNQHDSQELLAFLLDGLHEDLNRVINKPYIEAKDANDGPDDEFADECWAVHKARNDSIIVDVCEVFENRIYCYLDLFDSLSGIKNEDYLVAYRLPTNYRTFRRLEIMHHRTESLSEPQYNIYHQKLIGTPLVTCLSNDAKTGADFHAAVSTSLSPLLRVKATTKQLKASKDNGHLSSSDGVVPTDDDNSCSSDTEPSNSLVEIKEKDDGVLPFQIALTDDKGSIRKPIDTCNVLSSGSCVGVLLEWSEKSHELYDISFLMDLPEVFKSSSFMVKKTRQEDVTLFSCLDAFLKEEPLGPDDMWYCPSCKEHRQATKKLDLWRLPEVLVVHLKRFSYS